MCRLRNMNLRAQKLHHKLPLADRSSAATSQDCTVKFCLQSQMARNSEESNGVITQSFRSSSSTMTIGQAVLCWGDKSPNGFNDLKLHATRQCCDDLADKCVSNLPWRKGGTISHASTVVHLLFGGAALTLIQVFILKASASPKMILHCPASAGPTVRGTSR